MFSFCPKCKSDKLVFNNSHYWHCPDCDFLYFHNTATAVAAIIIWQGKVLLTTRGKAPGKGLLDLPGGFVDHNESLEYALTREVEEELGFNIPETEWRYLRSEPNQYHYRDIDYRTLDSVFTCELKAEPKLTCEPTEIADYAWVALSDVDTKQIAFPSLKKALELFISQHLDKCTG